MNVQQAKEVAREWVAAEGSTIPGFSGAFCHGSINYLRDDAVIPATSDVDVMVVCSGTMPENKIGKFLYQGLLLEVSFLPHERIQSPETVLSDYHLAGSFRVPSILMDPTGQLTELQAVVSRDFAKRRWVLRRCEHARSNALNCLKSIDLSAPLHDQVIAWLFANGIMTHILLVAGLKNPTVRRRYLAVRELLAQYDSLDFYQRLLESLGCAHLSRQSVEQHLAVVAEVFDATRSLMKTPYQFSADLSEAGRAVAIDGSRELIKSGSHHEAIFWMVATYSRCQWVLSHDASIEVQEQYTAGYRDMLRDLGIRFY
jgi:hypothetical protein